MRQPRKEVKPQASSGTMGGPLRDTLTCPLGMAYMRGLPTTSQRLRIHVHNIHRPQTLANYRPHFISGSAWCIFFCARRFRGRRQLPSTFSFLDQWTVLLWLPGGPFVHESPFSNLLVPFLMTTVHFLQRPQRFPGDHENM